MDKQQFIESIAGLVGKYAGSYQISVYSPIIAQAILESGWGESKLASVYHNYFGLKCGSRWTGRSVNMKTQEEYMAGTLTTITDNFRVYDSMEEGVKGYFEFIQLARYQNLKGIADPRQYIETIKADGYATSSSYVENNMKIIKQYQLTKYDRKEGNKMAKTRQAVVQKVQSWIGKNEADGSHRMIIDLYNRYTPHPRGYALKYSDPWCAGTVGAVAVDLGYTDIIPIECSCNKMIEIAQSMGIWIEDDNHVPQLAEFVTYDWEDNGIGDNKGSSDHIGIVVAVNKAAGTFDVTEGNKNNAVGTRTLAIGGKYIRGFISPRYDADGTAQTPAAGKTVDEVAREVIAGSWGNGSDRQARLEAAGYNYAAVQQKVNELCSGSAPAPTKSVDEVAREVIAGSWGNGSERKERLEAAGYDYAAVQNKVNELCGGSAKKSIDEVAREVIAGSWGNGSDRKARLEAAGYSYVAVQNRVNEIL